MDFKSGKIALIPPQWILLNILNGNIKKEYFSGIVNPEYVYKSKEGFILVFPGDYQHSSTLNNSDSIYSKKGILRIHARLENERVVEYKLFTE